MHAIASPRTNGGRCAVAGCTRAATHQVLEAFVDPAGRPRWRRDPGVPVLCREHARGSLDVDGRAIDLIGVS